MKKVAIVGAGQGKFGVRIDASLRELAFEAVKESDPLPPLPQGFSEPFYEVGFRFNPVELKGNP